MMNNFNNFNYDNIPPFLKQMIQNQQPQQQQPDQYQPPMSNLRSTNINNGMNAYEISSTKDIEYIEPDRSGRLMFLYCQSEKKVYIGRFNHVSQKTDYEEFISQGDIKLFQQKGNEDLSKVVDALVAVATRIDGMHGDVQELKEAIAKKPQRRKPATKKVEEAREDADEC